MSELFIKMEGVEEHVYDRLKADSYFSNIPTFREEFDEEFDDEVENAVNEEGIAVIVMSPAAGATGTTSKSLAVNSHFQVAVRENVKKNQSTDGTQKHALAVVRNIIRILISDARITTPESGLIYNRSEFEIGCRVYYVSMRTTGERIR